MNIFLVIDPDEIADNIYIGKIKQAIISNQRRLTEIGLRNSTLEFIK